MQPLGPRPKGKKIARNAPQFDLRSERYRMSGIDWAQINGIDVLTAQTVIAEVGADWSAFPGEKQFTSWLGLCPTNEQSGGKILNRRTRKVVNRATVAFRNAARTLLRSQSYLGAQYRRLRTRLGAPKAIIAMARKLACLFIGCSNADNSRWTKEPNTMKPDIANSKSDLWSSGRRSSVFN
jgi:transposase